MNINQHTIIPRVSPLRILMALVLVVAFGCFAKAGAQWTTPDGSGNINSTNTGNVGVGTSSPGVKLDVLSSINLIARFGSSAAAHTQLFIDSQSAYNANLTLNRGGVPKWYMGNRASNDRLSFIESTGTIELLTILQTGKVGIGTTAPTAYLHIMTAAADYESLRLHRNANTAGWGVAQLFALNNSSGATIDYAQISGGITTNNAGAENGVLAFYTRGSGTLAERMRVASDGSVGIGTASPTQKLEVNGSALISTLYGSSASGGGVSFDTNLKSTKRTHQNWVEQTSTTKNGQSGTPGDKLLVASDRLIVNNAGVRVNGATDYADLSVTKVNITSTDALQFRSTTPNIQSNGSLLFTVNNLNGDNVKFNVQNSTVSNAFVIDTNTATPVKLLDVRNLGTSKFSVSGNGDVTVSGNIAAKYQDVAEWVESSEKDLPPGTVVVLDSTKSNQG